MFSGKNRVHVTDNLNRDTVKTKINFTIILMGGTCWLKRFVSHPEGVVVWRVLTISSPPNIYVLHFLVSLAFKRSFHCFKTLAYTVTRHQVINCVIALTCLNFRKCLVAILRYTFRKYLWLLVPSLLNWTDTGSGIPVNRGNFVENTQNRTQSMMDHQGTQGTGPRPRAFMALTSKYVW